MESSAQKYTSKPVNKWLRAATGSDSSVDGELSYLDLDTGNVLSTEKSEMVSMPTCAYDVMMSNLLSFEKH
ncbi:hypothetical protein ACF0H5_006576 [Mactra antiquata]